MSSSHLTLRRGQQRGRPRSNAGGVPRHSETTREAVAEVLGAPVQARLVLGRGGDAMEREADAVADQIAGPGATGMAAQDARDQASDAISGPITDTVQDTASRIQARRGAGAPLPADEQQFFEHRLGQPLDQVRVHADAEAAQLSRSLSAQAFTVGHDVFFGQGQYRPGSTQGRHLIAHELAHVRQQAPSHSPAGTSASGAVGAQTVQRKLELRPPGKGEASAFGRAQELIDRLNTISPAIQYQLAGRTITYTIVDASALTHFDKTMQSFIDRGELVPMRLINAKGQVGGSPLFADSFISAYVDLDDLMADDIHSFQSDLLHFLTERFTVKNYDTRIGTNMGPNFPKAHQAGKEAEAAQLRALFRDPSIVFIKEDLKPNQTWVNAFKSKKLGFWVFQVVKHADRPVAGGEMWVQRKDGTRATMEEFRKERAAAAP